MTIKNKMKLTNIITIACLAILSSCGVKKPQQNEIIIGGQKDQNGCLTGAGYTWSQLKQTCIRPFEQGITLIQITSEGSFASASYILFSDDKKQAELFTPLETGSVLLKANNNGNYTNGQYQLKKENAGWTLYVDNTKLFVQENKSGLD